MQPLIQLTTLIKLASRSPWSGDFRFIALVFIGMSLGLSSQARAQCEEGCDTVAYDTFLGDGALVSNTSGYNNTAIGDLALRYNTTGAGNTASGAFALYFNTSGNSNVADGANALFNNTTGSNNTASGAAALRFSTTGHDNTADGTSALSNNSTGSNNVANGSNALLNNTIGSFNAVNGVGSLKANTTGNNNTADGYRSLFTNTTGHDNTADGYQALYNNTGSYNAADGDIALYKNTTGGNNVASGYSALYSNTTGIGNIALGAAAGYNLTTGSNNIDVGNFGLAGESGTIRIGTALTQTNTYIAGITGVTVAGGIGVIIDANGHLGTVVSSERFKDAIQPMAKASEAILALQPVTFRYRKELDPIAIPQFGLVAEQVEKVDPDLVARDGQGKPYSVRYEAVNAMLLNEFLKEHRKVETLRASVAQQQATNTALQVEIDELKAALNAQAAEIQKVSAQLSLGKPDPRLVVTEQ